jgi:hypothetical protein
MIKTMTKDEYLDSVEARIDAEHAAETTDQRTHRLADENATMHARNGSALAEARRDVALWLARVDRIGARR